MTKELPINRIICGDAIEEMNKFPENSIHMVMFSPPYWGLRDYGESNSRVWGGERECEHHWGNVKCHYSQPKHGISSNQMEVQPVARDALRKEDPDSSFCSECGAWYGQLGLEPHYQMYIQHLVKVGQAIKRVLRDDGSWYLNLGDTYAGSNTGHTGPSSSKWKNLPRSKGKSLQSQIDISAKCKMLMPHRVALALIDDGWICRNDNVWHKGNPMPTSAKDRLNVTNEFVFHFVQQKKYYYNLDAIRVPHKSKNDLERRKTFNNKGTHGGIRADLGRDRREYYHKDGKNPGDVIKTRGYKTKEGKPHSQISGQEQHHGKNINYSPNGKNPGDFWEINTKPFPEAHFAVYPPELCERPIKSSCPPDGIVLDPMCGAGTTLVVAHKLGRKWLGIDLNPDYVEMAKKRISSECSHKLEEFVRNER